MFDFALKELNIIIEFDGEQHRRPVRWHRSETPEKIAKRFAQIQLYDDMKNEWARKNGSTLLYGSFFDIAEMRVLTMENFILKKVNQSTQHLGVTLH